MTVQAGIFDVDGVLLASPHEQAWREALDGFADPARFTPALYQAHVAGRPRADGALAALEALDVPDAAQKASGYAIRKQARLEALIRVGAVPAFPDALRFMEAMTGWTMAAASSSKNANAMMAEIRLPGGARLLDVFAANVCGRDVPHGKPHPDLFLLAAAELGLDPASCLVVEDAPAGIAAAREGGMASLGIARQGDAALLRDAGADLVVGGFDEVSVTDLRAGRLRRSAA
jgi:HAD superfamily hydrolase (TIGR01509 family)